MKKMRLRVNAG